MESGMSTNTTNIATNTSGVSTNASNIATNTSGVSTNASNIATNTSGVSTNASNIATNTSGVSTNASNIATNTSGVSTNASNIATNTSGVSTNASNIATNTSNIGTNTTAIALNTAKTSTQWSNNSGDIYFNTGDVGIGVTNPSSALQVNGEISSGIGDTSFGALTLSGDGTGSTAGGYVTLAMAADYDSTYNYYHINVFEDDLRIGRDGLQDLTIASNGNVGVGSAIPQARLDVNGAIKSTSTGTIFYNGGAASGAPTLDGFRFRHDVNYFSATQDALIIEKTDSNQNDPDGGIAFLNTGMDGVAEPSLIIKGNGNVGLGTTSPRSTLQVVGYTQLDTVSGTPPAGDCDSALEYGRMKIDSDTGQNKIFACTADGWQSYVSGVGGSAPVGTVQCFAQPSLPAGYLETNLQAVSRTTYSALFAAIGSTYGPGDGSTTFNLPTKTHTFMGVSPPYRYIRLRVGSVSALDDVGVEALEFRWNDTWQANAMTNYSVGTIGPYSPTISASSEYAGYYAHSPFKAVTSARWHTVAGSFSSTAPNDALMENWLKVDFGVGNTVSLQGYRIHGYDTNGNYRPDDYWLEGSNDDTNWYVLEGSRHTESTVPKITFTETYSRNYDGICGIKY
jgi:microcystin-dependent protein